MDVDEWRDTLESPYQPVQISYSLHDTNRYKRVTRRVSSSDELRSGHNSADNGHVRMSQKLFTVVVTQAGICVLMKIVKSNYYRDNTLLLV